MNIASTHNDIRACKKYGRIFVDFLRKMEDNGRGQNMPCREPSNEHSEQIVDFLELQYSDIFCCAD